MFRGIALSCFVNFNDGDSVKIYAGHALAGHVIQQNVGYNDMGLAIESYWIGKNFDGGDPVRIKKFQKGFRR